MPASVLPAHLVSVKVAAERCGVDPRTVRRWIDADLITGYRVGIKLLKVDPDEIERRVIRRITHGAKLTCPSCGRLFDGHWLPGRDADAQQCPACGLVFEATWPGFDLEPETLVVYPPGQEPGRGAA
jgi:hypothetical protein